MKPDSGLLAELDARGLVAQRTAQQQLDEHLADSRVLYCGFDPTADSLHIGSLVPILMLRRFQLAGHKPIALVGGSTGLIGDPSFKAEERRLNTPDIVAAWVERLHRQLERFLDFEQGADNAPIMANNYDWMKDKSALDFLRDVGKHFSVNAMIQKESVKQRIEREGSGISFTEFAYILLQSYDFVELNKRYGCTLQLGGSDQWGNITGGIDLVRRMNGVQVYGLTSPLVTKSDGAKFGKTESGTIWLSSEKTSPYAFYQFWINTADVDAYKFMGYFTFVPVADIKEIEREDERREGRREVQSILAAEVTRLVHGEQGLQSAQRISEALFSGDLTRLSEQDWQQLALDGMPATSVSDVSIGLPQALVDSELAVNPRGQVSLGQARKLISDNAISINGDKVADDGLLLSKENALFGRFHLLRRGKKQYHLLVWK